MGSNPTSTAVDLRERRPWQLTGAHLVLPLSHLFVSVASRVRSRRPSPSAPGLPPVAARFELYLDGVELANGFHELVNGAEQRARFDQDQALRRARGQAQRPLDEHLLAALAAGMPDCAGVALGFDRLVAIALGAAQLADAMAFTIDNA